MMGLIEKWKAHRDAADTYNKVKAAEDPYDIKRRQERRDATIVTRIDFSYNPTDDCYE